MNYKTCLFKVFLCALVYLVPAGAVFSQEILDKNISIEMYRQPLGKVLNTIAKKGDFYFSYNSNLLNGDSLVNILATQETVRTVLNRLFAGRIDYKEAGHYLILRPAAVSREKWFTISGYVSDKTTGSMIAGASVYETQQLVSTLTNEQGYFRLRLKDKYGMATIRVSKALYIDTLLPVATGYDQSLQLTIEPEPVNELTPVWVSNRKVEKTWLGKFFLSSKQKMQSVNLRKFFTSKLVQMSLTPGLSTRGGMGAQVENQVSLNIIGGYTAGVNGVELAGLFNIDKKNVRSVQVAGLFNAVGGKMKGVQAAGFNNSVMDSVIGCQVSGALNLVKGNVVGVQASGYYNHVINSNMSGVQLAGVVNVTGGVTKGVQLSSITNISRKGMNGVQLSSIFNYTHKLRGVQIGLINVADTSEGYSIGLINISKTGYHQLMLYSNEITNMNLAYKAGNKRLYSILLAGVNAARGKKAFVFGYGLGTGFSLSKAWMYNTELTVQQVYLGNWENTARMYRIQMLFEWRLNKNIALFGGPGFTIYAAEPNEVREGYKSFPVKAYRGVTLGGNPYGWLGWQAGISFF